MPAGKMHIRGGVGTHISVTTFVSMDPYVKRGHVAPSPERKEVLCSEVLSELGSMLGFEKKSPAPTATQLRKSVTPVVTWARRWIKDDFSLVFEVTKEEIIHIGPRARLIAALEKLEIHELDFLWKAITGASHFRKNPTPDGLVSLRVLLDRVYADPMDFFENRRKPGKYKLNLSTDTDVAETAKLISKIVFDRAVFRIVTLARRWIAVEFEEDSQWRSQLVQSLQALSGDKRDLLWECMKSASLIREQRQALDHVMKPEILGISIEREPEAGSDVRDAIHLISEIVAAQVEKGGSPRPHSMRFAVFAAGVWTEWTGRTCLWLDESHRYWPFKEWLNEQLDSVSGGRLGEDMVEWVARAPKASKEQKLEHGRVKMKLGQNL